MSPALAQTKFYNEDDYYNLPDDTKAELIDGQFYNMSAPSRAHQEILMFLSNKIVNHINSKNGSCKVCPAPFAVKLTERGCTGAPDWIIEIISSGNPGHDYVRKLNLYADAGVGEYWIVDPLTKEISVYHLKEQNFRATSYTFQESITPGLFNLYIDFTELEL